MDISTIQVIFTIIILIMSVVIHEAAHGYAAYIQGDLTAKYQGRLTLNPIKHLDPFGSVLVPIFMYFTTGFTFGWAKPVPYNPYNLRNQRWGEIFVAAAGPGSNILIAIVFGLIIRTGLSSLPTSALGLCAIIVGINLSLAIFNLIPIPPLDGSKILFGLLPHRYQRVRYTIEQYSFVFVIIFAFLLADPLGKVVTFLFSLLTGIKF